jgi:AAA domain, putative AbiEii toxin, Type IV TA system
MGEGTVNVLTLLAHLSSATGKLFLIEEIENDLHPGALKALLEIIIERSGSNQFIISTHNNIVVKYLGTVPNTKLFSIAMEQDSATKIPISSCKPISDKPEDRIQLLENLGYEPFDFYLWKGYLILEESSAETIIRDFLIPFMCPKLHGKLQTIAASGVTDVKVRFSDLLRLFVFIHTSPQYYKRAWVAVDSGNDGEKTISGLKSKFKNWPKTHFRCFKEREFENYYPEAFKEKAEPILAMPKGVERQLKKGQLAKELLDWALANQTKAKKEFKVSAKEILKFLAEIQKFLRL